MMNPTFNGRVASLFAEEGSKRLWAIAAFVIALGLLLSFYSVVTAVGKRAEEQKAQATQQAQVFWRCIELARADERRACHERNATSADRPATAQPVPNTAQFAGLKS